MEEKVKTIYNDCWKSYRQYTEDKNMAAYNERSKELLWRHGASTFLQNILLAFAPVVQGLDDTNEEN